MLHNADDFRWQEKVKAWQKHPDNKKITVAGDDRSPAFTWLGKLYHDGEMVTVPSDNVMTMFREGGAGVIVSGKKTFKAQTQSGIIPLSPEWTLYANNEIIPVEDILKLEEDPDFDNHIKAVNKHGFDLFIKRAKIGRAKHIRVRPIFYDWRLEGEIIIIDEMITDEVLGYILDIGGSQKGLCDWRPSSPTPGRFGTFIATFERID